MKKTRSSRSVDVHVGQQLRVIRLTLGVSQEELGNKVGVTFQQIQKYEKGLNRISASKLYEFSRVVGESPLYFFEGLPTIESTARSELSLSLDDIQPDTFRLLKLFNKLKDPAVKRSIKGLIISIIEKEMTDQPE